MPLLRGKRRAQAPQVVEPQSAGVLQYAPPPGPPPNWLQVQTPPTSMPSSSTAIHVHSSRPSTLSTSTGKRVQAHNPETRLPSRSDELKSISRASKAAKGNAQVLHEALVYAKPEDLRGNAVIEEFLQNCRRSQEQIASHIPWLTMEAERSRERTIDVEQTREEIILAELLAANEEVLDVLKMYGDLVEQGKRDLEKAQQRLRALAAITSFQPSALESALTDRIFAIGDPNELGYLRPEIALDLFQGANLPLDVMHRIWEIANVEENEVYGKYCVAIAVRLIGYAQHGEVISEQCVLKAGLMPTIHGLEPRRHLAPPPLPRRPSSATPLAPTVTPVPPTPPPKDDLKGLPPLTEQDRLKFMQIFQRSGPENGVLSGQRAREVLLKSRLPGTILREIWDLADSQRRGYLDAPGFTIAMYLVQACMSGQITAIPPSLPSSLYAAAGLSSPHAILEAHYGINGAGSSMTAAGPSTTRWIITPELRSTADAFFAVLDEQRNGFLDPEMVKAHFAQTRLPRETLDKIWDLSDVDSNGRLSRDEFAIALLLIQANERGVVLPQSTPESLIPAYLQRNVIPSSVPVATSTPMTEFSLIDLDEPEQMVPMSMPIPMIGGQPLSPTSSISIPIPTSSSPLSPTLSAIWRPQRSQSTPTTPSTSPSTPDVIPSGWTWDISPADKVSSDKFFDTLDPWKHGYVEGDAAVGFMSKSKLPPPILAKIWDLADMDHDGRLTKEEFAVAMHLIRNKLSGKDVPDTLPPSLVPPMSLSNTAIPLTAAPVPQVEEIEAHSPAHTSPPVDADDMPRSNTPPPPYKAYDENTVENV